jgi:hypothetical protein
MTVLQVKPTEGDLVPGLKRVLLLAALAALVAAPAAATTIVFQDLGVIAPPATIGGYAVATFPVDSVNAPLDLVTAVPSPRGGNVAFTTALTDATLGADEWKTWSHPYAGDVYYTKESSDNLSVTLTLPDGLPVFYFYLEPNLFLTGIFDVTASDGLGAVATTPLAGVQVEGDSGARGFAFYSPDSSIRTITITERNNTMGFGIGEFGTLATVPEPATLTLLVTGLAGGAIRRFRRRTDRSRAA